MTLFRRSRTVLLGLWLACAAALPGQAQPLPAGLSLVTQVEGVSEYRLANGLQVLLVPDSAKPTTTVNVTYRVGSRHESYGETGMAHLLEHLIFKGTPTHRNLLGEFAKRGLRANGTTWFDRTNYFASFTANDENLRWYLEWQADAMVNSRIAREDLDTEMTVVRNELEMGQNNPFRSLLQQVMGSMYRWHNYGKSTIGARADVENVDIPRLQAFYRTRYQPDNATLVVAGKFDSAAVLALVAKSFGPIPRPTRVLPRTYTVEQPQDGERAVTVRRVGGAPMLLAGWQVMAGAAPDHAAVEAIANILGDVPSGRLHKRLVQRQLAASVFAFEFSLAEPGPMFVGAQLSPGQDPQPARAELLASVEALGTEPITEEELARAKTQLANEWDKGFNDPERVGVALSEAIGNGDWRLYFLARDRMKSLSLADVRRVASTWLVADNRSVGIYLPSDKPQRAPAPVLVDVAPMVKDYKGQAAVAQAETFDATPANLQARSQRFSLDSGLKVALLPKGTRGDVVEARLQLHYGDEASLRGQASAARALGNLLDKGGAGMSRAQIADAFDNLRAQVAFSSGGQTLSVSISTVKDKLVPVIALVGKLLRAPQPPAEALEELRRQALAQVAAQRVEPAGVAAQALERHFNSYAADDIRYSPDFDEQVARINALSLAQVLAFQRLFVSAAVGEFSAVGAMDAAAVRQALAQALGDWAAPAGGPQAYARVPQPLVAKPALRQLIATPDKANAQLALALPMPVRDIDPDYPALLMANQMLGGSSSSRLFSRIREKEGLSYGVGSYVQWGQTDANSRFNGYAIFAPQNQAKVEVALRQEVDRALADGFTATELNEARNGLLSARRLSRAQDPVVAGRLVNQLYLGRDFALEQQVDDALIALTPEQVLAALRRHVDPGRWVAIWAGDFKP